MSVINGSAQDRLRETVFEIEQFLGLENIQDMNSPNREASHRRFSESQDKFNDTVYRSETPLTDCMISIGPRPKQTALAALSCNLSGAGEVICDITSTSDEINIALQEAKIHSLQEEFTRIRERFLSKIIHKKINECLFENILCDINALKKINTHMKDIKDRLQNIIPQYEKAFSKVLLQSFEIDKINNLYDKSSSQKTNQNLSENREKLISQLIEERKLNNRKRDMETKLKVGKALFNSTLAQINNNLYLISSNL